MAVNTFSVLSLILIQVLPTIYCGASYEGCFPEDFHQRFFDVNPGDYDPNSLTPETCSAKCGAYGKKYAAVTVGRFCFCGENDPTVSKVDNNLCQEVCSGNSAVKCGGKTHVSLYLSSPPITGLVLSSDVTGTTKVTDTVTFTVGISSGSNVYYQMDYGDGAGLSDKNATGFETAVYNLPGTYTVRVEANDFNDTLAVQKAVTTVAVQAPVAGLEVLCDAVFATYDEGKCVATVWQGTSLSLQATIPSTYSQTLDIADPILAQCGPGIPTKPSASGLLSRSYTGTILAQASLVEHPGRVIGWEVNVNVVGTLKVLILSPNCGGNVYCPYDNMCKAACDGLPEVYATTCSGGTFCPKTRLCDTGTCTAPTRFSTTDMNVASYTVKYVVDVVVSGTGYQYVSEAGLVEVKAGDILGLDITASAGAKPFWLDCPAGRGDFTQTGGAAQGATITTTGLSTTGDCMAIRGAVSEGSQVYLPFLFTGENTYPLTITVSNKDFASTPATNQTDLVVVEGVNFTIIEGPTYIRTNTPQTYTVASHTGSGAVYTWDSNGDGTGTLAVNVTDRSKALTYPTKGTYNLTVTTANAVSSKTNTTVVIVQDAVTGLDVTTNPAAVGEAYAFLITLTTGSDYTCTWTFGDGQTESTDEVTTPAGIGPTTRTHTYATKGTRAFSVTCSNQVSSATKALTLQVHERISGLALAQQGQDSQLDLRVPWKVTSGSGITWAVTLNGAPMAVDPAGSNPDGYSWTSVSMGKMSSAVYTVNITGTNALGTVSIQESYTLTTAIVGFQVAASTANTTTGTVVQYTLTLAAGSDVNVTLDYKDGTVDSEVVVGDWPAAPKQYSHTFGDGGRYGVHISVSNPAGTFQKTLEVLVLEGVSDIQMFSPDYALYSPPSHIDVWFELSPGKSKPTEPRLVLDFGYKNELISEDLRLNHNYTRQFNDRGTFHINAVVSNSLDKKVFNRTLTILDILQGAVLKTAFNMAPKGQDLDVTFSLYRGPTSHNCNLTWDSGDPALQPEVTPRTGDGQNGFDIHQIRYPNLGTYQLKVTATTALQTLSQSLTMVVVEPVLNSSLQVTANSANNDNIWGFGVEIEVIIKWTSATIPHSPLIDAYWGDGSQLKAKTFPITGAGSVEKLVFTPTKDGLLITNITIYNDASMVKYTLKMGVYKPFLNMQLNSCYFPELPVGAPCQTGLTPGSQLFSSDQPIRFQVLTDNNAKATYYEITATVGGVSFSCNRTENPFFLQLNVSGSYTVSVTAINPLHSDIKSTTVSIVEKVVGLQVSHDLTKDAGAPKTFFINYTTQGSETCLMIDWGDNTKSVYADPGKLTSCNEAGFVGIAPTNAITNTREVTHTFLTQKTFHVRFIAKNAYSTLIKTLDVEITGLDCSQPQVTILNSTKNFQTPTIVERGKSFQLRSISQIACDSFENVKAWTIETVDEKWGTVSGVVNLASSNTVLSDALLSLSPWALDYKLYKCTFTMSMVTSNPALAFKAVDYTYIRIVEPHLVGIMVKGGSSEFMHGTSGGNLVLQPLQYSYDPGVLNNNPLASGMQVTTWYCSYKNGSEGSGCSALISAGTLGSSGSLNFDVRNLMEGETYRIGAKMDKGTRTVWTYVNITIVAGQPPQVSIRCVGGSICHQLAEGFLVPGTSKLSLRGDCDNCVAGDNIQYQWGVYISAYRWPDGWRPLDAYDLNNRTVGLQSRELQLTPALFEAFKNKSTRYKVECLIYKNGVKGWAAIKVTLNNPPTGGSCTIEPKQMVVTSDKLFRIKCDGWTDDTNIAAFRFLSYFGPQTVKTLITVEETNLGHVDLNVSLCQGAEYDDYNNVVRVQVVDNLGAMTERDIGTVKVTPVPTTQVRQMVDEFLSNPKNSVTRKFAEGDTTTCTELVSSFATMLNSDKYEGFAIPSTQYPTGLNQRDTSRIGGYSEPTKEISPEMAYKIEEEINQRAKTRAILVAGLSQLPNQTLESKTQIMSAISEVLRSPHEVDSKTQVTVMVTLEAFSGALDSTEPYTPEERYETSSYAFDCVGKVASAGIGTMYYGTKSQLREAQNSELFHKYDVENTVDSNNVPCLKDHKETWEMESIDDAVKQQQQLALCQIQLEVVRELERKTQRVLNSLRNSFKQNTVEGEAKQFNTDNLRCKMAKTALKSVHESTKMDHTDSGVDFPQNVDEIFPGGNSDGNSTVLVQVVESSDSLTRSTEGGRDIPTFSRILSIDLFDDNGAMSVSNTSVPINISIANAPDTPGPNESNVDPTLTTWNIFQLHRTELTKKGASLHFTICPQNKTVYYVVVMNLQHLPNPSDGNCTKAFLVNASQANCTTYHMDNYEVNDFVGEAYIGVRQLTLEEAVGLDLSNCSRLPRWQSGAENATQFTGNYSITLFSSSCYVLHAGAVAWSTNSCRVAEGTNKNKTVCQCTHLTTFAGGWVVVPNAIDWAYVFDNMDFMSNVTLYVTEIVVALVYIVAVIWARRKDRRDVEKLGIAPLLDNDPKDKYYYEIVIVTGMRRNAGTDSKVFFILSGEDDETDVREFSDSKRKIFRRGETNGFLMATPRPLGYLNYARLWHDNSGKGSMGGWYMNYMIVRDVQSDEKWVFIADKWFAVEEDDGQVDRIIPVATRENMTEFSHMFAESARKNLADGHLWFSVVARPPASRFTCVQRVSCCLCLLFVSMLANAMFYKTDSDSSSSNGISFGPFSVTPEQIFIGVISNLIVFPVNFVIITLFRKSRPRKLRPSRVDLAIKTAHDGPRTEASVTDIKPEVSSIFSVSRPSSMMANPRPPRPESSLSRPGTSLSTRADASLPTKKKKAKSLPWWCRIVAWVILWASTIVSIAVVTAYGITFAEEKCKKWISSMLISFFMSVFITQPVKVFLVAIFLSLIIKNPGEEEEEEEERDEEKTKLANDEIPLHELNADSYGAARPRKIGYKPPDRSTLEAARQKRLNEIQMWSIVREVVIYSFFLWILLVISYRQRNGDTFLYKDTMERVYIKNNETDIDFEKVRNVKEYYNWARSGLVNGIRAGPYYNDYPPLMLRGYVNDKVSKILGYATMRQLRIRPSLCEMDERMMTIIRECNIGYDISDQEEGTFDIGWKARTENSTDNHTAEWYKYTDSDTLDGYPYWGQLNVYAGGGYVVPLKGSRADLIALMTRLEEEEWIDRYTRAVFVEFTTYNAQVNLFGIACILAEFHPTGGVVQTYRFEPAMLLPYMTSAMLFQLVCEAVYCFFIIFFIVRLVRAFLKEKLAFFKGFWNLVEMGIIAMSLGAIVIYFYRLFETNKLTSRFKETNGIAYIKFQYVGYWNEIFTYMMGWTVFFATLKFMRLLRFNKRMSLLAATLRNGARSLLHFSIIFWIVFLAFSMLFFLSYMTIDIKYSSFIGSVVSGILMMMGKFDIYAMTMAEPVLTQIFVFLFVVSVTFIIVNMFVSILTETFSAVRDDVSKQSNDYEIISFMIGRFKRFTGMGGQAHNTLTPEEQRNQELEQRYAEGRGNSCVDDFPERIDRLLHSISNVYMEQEHMSAMMDKRGYQHGMPATAAKGGGGYDNPAYVGTRSKTSELSKVHTH